MEQLKRWNATFGPYLFFLGLTLVIVSAEWWGISGGIWKELKPLLNKVGIVLLLLRIGLAFPQHPKRSTLECLALGFLGISAHLANDKSLFLLAVAILASEGIVQRTLTRFYQVALGLILGTGLLGFATGIFWQVMKHRHALTGYSLGLNNPNMLALVLVLLVLATLWLQNIRRERTLFLVCIAAAVGIYALTLSLTLCLVLALVPVLYLLVCRLKPHPVLVAPLPWLALLLSLVLALCFGPGQGDITLESRFSIPYLIYNEYGLSWLGQNCHLKEAELALDNLYLRVFLVHGILPGLLLLTFLSALLYRVFQGKDYFLQTLLLCLIPLSFMEVAFLNVCRCFLPFAIGWGAWETATHPNCRKRLTPPWTFLAVALLGTTALGVAAYRYVYLPKHQKHVVFPRTKVGDFWVEDHPSPNIGEGKNRVEAIILHHTASTTIKDALGALCSPKTQVSSHCLIDVDGTRYILAAPEAIAWHAGYSLLDGKEKANEFSIGIEFQGNTEEAPLTEQQIQSAIDYILPLMEKYHITPEHIVTHQMIRQNYIDAHPGTDVPQKVDITPAEYQHFMQVFHQRVSPKE